MPHRMSRRDLLVLLAASAALAACGRAARAEDAQTMPQSTLPVLPDDARLAPAWNGFGIDLFRGLGAGGRENVVASPLSVATALSMTYTGAGGETAAQMARLLGLEGMSLDDACLAAAGLTGMLLRADPKVTLTIANSLWSRQGFALEPAFLDRNRQYFAARISELNFADPGAVDTINAWVAENTRGLIPTIIDEIGPDLVLFLINAVYFKGMWKEQFKPEATTQQPFHRADGSAVTVPMMMRGGQIAYFEGDGVQVAELPYGDGRFAMTLVLPAPGGTLATLVGRLSADVWNGWVGGLRPRDVDLSLPRFKVEYKATLNQVLIALGMRDAFDNARADLTGMRAAGGLVIDEVKHKTFIEVNEEGTEAAAVTSVGVRLTSLPVRFSFVADRPFLLAIRDTQSGALLFLGAIANPA